MKDFDMAVDDKLMESKNQQSFSTQKEKKFWTKSEDDLLLGYINKTQNKNWRVISEYIKTKSPQQCAYRYSKLLSDMNKKKWNRKDDIKLIELVETYGHNWEIISKMFGDRSERDVEARYKDKLDPIVKNTKFSQEEDSEILRLYEEYGNDWFQIARFFKNRNSKMIKKRFQTFLKFNCKKSTRRNRKNSKISQNSLSINLNNSTSNSFVSTPKGSSQGVITPRSSLGAITPRSTQVSITPIEETNSNFNVDLFFDRELPQQKSEFDLDIFSCNYLKIDLHSSYSNQIENIDKYFSQICLFYTEKSLQLEQSIAKSTKSGFEIDNIVNINSQVSNQVEMLMSKIHQMQKERVNISSEKCYKAYIVKYIEIILQIIQQIKIKVNLI